MLAEDLTQRLMWKNRRPERIDPSSTVPFALGSLIAQTMAKVEGDAPMEPPQQQPAGKRPPPSSLSSWRLVLAEAGVQEPKKDLKPGY